jgi:hypothetical protein
MNKLLIIPLFLLFGCEIYEQPSNPQLNLNGRWNVVKIKVVIDKVNFNSHVTVLSENVASVSNFYVKQINNDGTLLLSQDFNGTSVDRRFDIDKTTWDFQYNQLRIYENTKNVVKNDYIFVEFPCTYCKKNTVMEWDYMGYKTRYTFLTDTYGAMPSNEMVLTSQSFFTTIKLGGNTYDKAIESHLEITFHKL